MKRLARCRFISVIGAVWLSLHPALFAQERIFDVDPGQTRVDFTVGDVLHTVHGSFKVKQGAISIDPATGKAGGVVLVDATSGESGSGARDRKMHKDILESAKYPEISIEPVRVSGNLSSSGESKIELQGNFKLHGSEHRVTLMAVVQINGDEWSATMHLVVPYVSWGLKNPSTFILRVNDTVDVDISARGRIRPPSAP